MIYLKQGNTTKAIQCFSRSIEVYPSIKNYSIKSLYEIFIEDDVAEGIKFFGNILAKAQPKSTQAVLYYYIMRLIPLQQGLNQR